MPRKPSTHEEFMKKFYIKNKNAENIEILGEYVNSRTKIKCKCKLDGHEWEVKPNDLLKSYGCPKCKKGKTHEQFMKDFYIKNSNAENIEILGRYESAITKIKCKCKLDNNIWYTTPHNLLDDNGCPKCKSKNQSKRQTKTHEQFMEEFYIKNSNAENIEILGEYVNAHTKIKCKCKLDNNIWETEANHLLKNVGCPKCNASKGESKISKYLDNKNIKYEEQYKFDNCKSKKELPFDFYIPSLNIAIEYDGRQHYEIIDYFGGLDGFIETKIRDTIKTIYCKENNIKLIRIPYTEYDNIEKILEKELL